MALHLSGCCNRLFYYPTAETYSTPAERGLAFERVEFASGDGTRLSGWFIPSRGRAKGTIVHCHGNAQNMTAHWLFVEFLPSRGFNVLVFDYRGYGASDGRPTREGTVADARAAVEYVLSRRDVDARRVGLLGQSLGGAIATVVAAGNARIRALVIESAFSSYRAEARHVLRANPITYLLAAPLAWVLIPSGLDPVDSIGSVAPRAVLIIHGTADRVVPCWMSGALADAARGPKELWVVEGAGHTEAGFRDAEEYERRVSGFFEKAFEAE